MVVLSIGVVMIRIAITSLRVHITYETTDSDRWTSKVPEQKHKYLGVPVNGFVLRDQRW